MTRTKPKTDQTQTPPLKSARRGRRGGRGRHVKNPAQSMFELGVRALLKIKETADE